MSFGSYLRNVREARLLTLDEVAERTKIKRHLLADLEEDDLALWPKFLVYRHGYVRTIADVLNLDRDDVLDRFDEAFPDYAPVAFDGGKRAKRSRATASSSVLGTTREAAALAVALGLVVGLALSSADRRRTAVGDAPQPARIVRIVDSAGKDIVLEPDVAEVETAPASSIDVANNDDEVADIEGEVRVVSSPPGASVTVNGVGRGRTPASVRYLPLGSYTIRIVDFGYVARETRVTLTQDEPIRRVRVALRARK
jgi:transcriptional regulator with XRE-family HTH domain